MRTLGWCTQTGASEQEERGWSMNSGGRGVGGGGSCGGQTCQITPRKLESTRSRSERDRSELMCVFSPWSYFQSSITSRWSEASTLRPMRMERLSLSQSLCQTDKSPRLGPLFSFQMWNRWIFFFSLHFIDLCIMAPSLHRRTDVLCPGSDEAARALCCLLFSPVEINVLWN